MPNIGPTELIIVLVIILVIFGPKRLPGLGKSLGSGMREFKDSIGGKSKDEDDHAEITAGDDQPVAAEADAEGKAEPATGDTATGDTKSKEEEVFGPRG